MFNQEENSPMTPAEMVALDRQAIDALGIKVDGERFGKDVKYLIKLNDAGCMFLAAALTVASRSLLTEDHTEVVDHLTNSGSDPTLAAIPARVRNSAVASIARGVATALALKGAVIHREIEQEEDESDG